MEQRDTGQRKTPPVYKIIILGESNVGKSSLFLRYTEDRFKEAIANTIGVNNTFKELVIDGKPVHFQMWDTAGQERFRSIVSAFYRESDGFVFVYDVTSDRSFDYMCQLLDELREAVDPRFTLVVGNKVDCADAECLAAESERLKVLARQRGFHHYLSSAKTGENVNEMFEALCKDLFHMKSKEENAKNVLDITRKKKKGMSLWCFK